MENTATILAALAPLLADLGKFLEARQCGVTELECRLRHRHAPPSRCVLRLSTPLAEIDRLTELLLPRDPHDSASRHSPTMRSTDGITWSSSVGL